MKLRCQRQASRFPLAQITDGESGLRRSVSKNRVASVGWIPDHGEHAVIVLGGGAMRDWRRACADQTGAMRATGSHFAVALGAAAFSLTDLEPLGQNADVGMGLGGLVAVRDDVDIGTDGDGPELALVGAVVVLGRRIRSQSWSCPLSVVREEPIPSRWRDRNGERNAYEPERGEANAEHPSWQLF